MNKQKKTYPNNISKEIFKNWITEGEMSKSQEFDFDHCEIGRLEVTNQELNRGEG